MDFNLHEDLVELQGLVREIFADHSAPDRLVAVEASPDRFDEVLWAALTGAGILGLTVPELHGGAGLGIAAAAVVLEQQGIFVSAVPLAAALLAAEAMIGAPTDLADDWLPRLATGERRLTLALEEPAPARFTRPGATATSLGEGWLVNGTKAAVSAYADADGVVLTASAPDGVALFLVDCADAPGLQASPAEQSDRSMASRLDLRDVPARRLGGADAVAALWLRARLAATATQLGVATGAVTIAADYVTERNQFGQPLGAFQSVQHRLADAHIGVDALRVALWQALDDVERGRPAARSALVAQWWMARAGMDVVLGTQHVHGGIGVDVGYPIHRYFLWGRQLATMYGGSLGATAELGDLLVEEFSS